MTDLCFPLPTLFRPQQERPSSRLVQERTRPYSSSPSYTHFYLSIQQTWTFPIKVNSTTINALVSLSLHPATVDSDFIQVKDQDQTNAKDYSNTGAGKFAFKKWQADKVAGLVDNDTVQFFKHPNRDPSPIARQRYRRRSPEALLDNDTWLPLPSSLVYFPVRCTISKE